MTINGYSDLSICSNALTMIGADVISSFDEETDVAATCARLWPLTRDSLLSRYNWNISAAERQLARSAEVVPLREYSYAYRLPSNMLSGPFAVYADGGSVPTTDYAVRGDYLYSNAETVIIVYAGGADPGGWPVYLVELGTVALAARLAKPVMDSVGLRDSLAEEAFGLPGERGMGGLFAQARLLDAQARRNRNILRNGNPLSNTRY